MPPETRYAKAATGLVAYQVVGDGPIDLVYLTGSTSHVDVRWELPAAARFYDRLASFSRLIMFDRRGAGASDPVPLDALPTWEEWADDLAVVMDAAGSERAAIFAVLDAGPMAMLFAATKPDRTTALVLGNTSARVLADDDYPSGMPREVAEGLINVLEASWGSEDFSLVASPSLVSDPRALAWFAKYQRASASPRVAAAQVRWYAESDFREVLPSIHVPTLVLHRKDYRLTNIEQGRYLADHILGAKFVEVPGADSLFITDGAELVLDTVEEFLTGVKRRPEPDRVLATVLFTDLVDSTGRAAAEGDRGWRALLDRHDELARSEVERHRGRVLKTTGDGILATLRCPGARHSLHARSARGDSGTRFADACGTSRRRGRAEGRRCRGHRGAHCGAGIGSGRSR